MPVETAQSLLKPQSYYLSGNEAAAEGALAAGCNFYAGYPITPSSEIMERIAWRLAELERVFIQMEDEIGSICAVIGAAWAGAKAMTATSGPGFSLMMEGLGYAALTETPIVVIDVQRAGPATGQATRVGSGDIMQAKWGSHGDYQIIAHAPWSVQEMYDLTIRAFNMAERYRVPSIVLAEETTGHLRETVLIGPTVNVYNRQKEPGAPPFDTQEDDGVPPMPAFGEGEELLVTGSTHDRYGFRKTDDPTVHARLISRLHNKIMNHRDEIVDVETYYCSDNLHGLIICYGFTARSALFAAERLQSEGKKVGMLRLKTLWPFPDAVVHALSERTEKFFVPEMNMGQVAGEVRKHVSCDVVTYNQTDGEVIHPHTIVDELKRIL